MGILGGFFGTIWHWLQTVYWWYVGDLPDTWRGVAALIYVTAILLSFVIAGYRSIHHLLKGVDIGFSQDRLDRYNRELPSGAVARQIDWIKVRKQQVRSLRFTLPYGMLMFATLYCWVRFSFNLWTYFILWGVLLLLSPVFRAWWIAVMVWDERKRYKKGTKEGVNYLDDKPRYDGERPREGQLATVSVRWAVRHYLNWGLGADTRTTKPRGFFGVLRFLNPFIKPFYFEWVRLRALIPVWQCMVIMLFWVVTAPISVLYLTFEFEKRTPKLKPEWSNSGEPMYDSGAIPDTRGDAAAADG